MCLTKIAKFKPRYVGYKVFLKNGDEYRPTIIESPVCKMGRWYSDKEDRLLKTEYDETCIREIYPTGFHVFETLDGAKIWLNTTSEVIVKVRYKKVVAKGYQGRFKVVVAKKIFLEKDLGGKR